MIIKDALTGLAARVLEGGILRVSNDHRELLEAAAGNSWIADPSAQAATLTKTAATEILAHFEMPTTSKKVAWIHSLTLDAAAATRFRLVRVTGTPAATTAGAYEANLLGVTATPDLVHSIWDEVAGGITGLTVAGSLGGVRVLNTHTFAEHPHILIPPGQALAIEGDATAGEVGYMIEVAELDLASILG